MRVWYCGGWMHRLFHWIFIFFFLFFFTNWHSNLFFHSYRLDYCELSLTAIVSMTLTTRWLVNTSPEFYEIEVGYLWKLRGRVETNGTILTKSFRQVSLRSGQQYVLYDVYHFCVHASESLRVHIACTYFMVASCRIAEISLNREWTQTTLLDRVYFFFVIDFPNFLFFATSSELQRDMSCCQSLDTLNLSYRSRGKR